MKDNELFSVKNEVAVNQKLQYQAIANETPQDEIFEAAETSITDNDDPKALEHINFSVAAEPFVCRYGEQYRNLLAQRSAAVSNPKIWWSALAAGLLGGLFAVVGCLLGNGTEATLSTFLLMVVVCPFMEEVLKESGTIYLLEKRPWLLRFKSQFFITAALAGLTFSVAENLFYQYIYLAHLPKGELTAIMSFRWRYCTILHMFFAQFSALGLCKAWRRMMDNGRPFEMKETYYYFIAAATVHGIYNFTVTIQSFCQ